MSLPQTKIDSAYQGVKLASIPLDDRRFASVSVTDDTTLGRYATLHVGNTCILIRDPGTLEQLASLLQTAASLMRRSPDSPLPAIAE